MPCCFSAEGVSAELEKVLTERKVLQGQRHELRVRINEAPQKLHALRQKIRKSLKAQAEIARLQRLYKAKIARDRNAATCAATALSSSSLFEEAQLLEYMGLEPDLPCLLLEAWSKEEGISVLLGEQWLNWGVLGDARQRIEVALEPRVLLSRNEKKTNIQSTCGGSLLGTSGSRGSLLLHFSCKDTNLEKDKVLFDLHLSSKRPWKQSVIPTAVALKVWSWGGSAESLKAQTTSEGSQVRQKTVERITCWLQAIEGCHKTDSKVSEIPSGDGGDWLQVGSSGDEVLVIGRHHSLFQRLLEDKKDYLSCISREHLRLWFDSKSEILYIENLSNNPIAVQDRVDSEPSTIASGKVARTKHGDLLRFIAPESLRKVDAVHGAFLSFRIVVQKPRRLSNCAGKNCKGGGGDPLYTVNATDETSDGQFLYCGSCCVQLHLANPSYTFRQTSETLRPRWKLLCESHAAVKTSKHVETYPTSQLPRGSASQLPSGLWVADFGTQKLHLPVAVHEGATLNEKQVERREAQLEHAKRAEAELLGQAKDGNLLEDSIEDTHFEQPQLFESAENLDSSQANGELPASEGSFVPESRTIELTADQQGQVAEVPCELQGKIIEEPTEESQSKEAVEAVKAVEAHEKKEKSNEGNEAKDERKEPTKATKAAKATNEDREISTKAANRPDGQRKRRILHVAEPLVAHPDMKDNHHRLLRLLWQKSGLLHSEELMEVYAAVQAASSIGLSAKVTLQFVATGRKFSRLEATLHVDFGALHCECNPHALADGLPTVLLERQMSSFQQLIHFELMDVLGQPPLLDVKATLGSSEEDPESVSFQLQLPMLITSFLKPVRPTFRFVQEWDAPDLQAAANVDSTADRMRSENAAALTFGGSLQLFRLSKDIIGLAAELPAHGCHESQAVLVRIAAFADGGMTLQSRSQDLRLAQAVSAALASVLQSEPPES